MKFLFKINVDFYMFLMPNGTYFLDVPRVFI